MGKVDGNILWILTGVLGVMGNLVLSGEGWLFSKSPVLRVSHVCDGGYELGLWAFGF